MLVWSEGMGQGIASQRTELLAVEFFDQETYIQSLIKETNTWPKTIKTCRCCLLLPYPCPEGSGMHVTGNQCATVLAVCSPFPRRNLYCN